jgi:hypothetical protein
VQLTNLTLGSEPPTLRSGPPPPGYVCFRCSVPGHWIAQCPTNADPNFDVIRMKNAYGIPQNRLEHVADGVLVAPTGESSNLMAADDEFSSMMGFLVDREKKNEKKTTGDDEPVVAALPAPAPGGGGAGWGAIAALPAPVGGEREGDAANQITRTSNGGNGAAPDDESDALDVTAAANANAAAAAAAAAPPPRANDVDVLVDIDGEDLDLGPDPSDDLGPEPDADDNAATADRPDSAQGVCVSVTSKSSFANSVGSFFFSSVFAGIALGGAVVFPPVQLFFRFTPNNTTFFSRERANYHSMRFQSAKHTAPPFAPHHTHTSSSVPKHKRCRERK